MSLLVFEEAIDARIDMIKGGYEDNLETGDSKSGYASAFCDPLYSRASIIGCFLSIIQ
jgi:hypothetical protein